MFARNQVYTLSGSLLMAILVVIAVAGQEDCVSNYDEFQDATFNKGNDNQFRLHRIFYPTNRYQPKVVEVTYQTTLCNGTTVDIITNGAGYSNIVWVWLASPGVAGRFLNPVTFSLTNVNIIRDLIHLELKITVPNPCENRTFDFLKAMTSSLKDYAAGHTKLRTNSANVVVMDISNNFQLYHVPTANGADYSGETEDIIVQILSLVFTLVCKDIFVWGFLVVLIKPRLSCFVGQMADYSHQYYGLAWGGSITAVGILVSYLLQSEFVSFLLSMQYNAALFRLWVITWPMYHISVFVLPGIPIAVYFVRKTTPPPVPYIFLLPTALLCCCCKTRYAQAVMFGLGLFLYMTTVHIIVIQALTVFSAILADPLITITDTLTIILLIFCATNIFAILFTISAYICTERASRRQKSSTLLKAALLVPLFLFIAMCSLAQTREASMTYSNSSDARTILMKAMAPIIIGALIFALKKLVAKVLCTPHEFIDGDAATSTTPLLRDDHSHRTNSDPKGHVHNTGLLTDFP